jgi:hypothetical protein
MSIQETHQWAKEKMSQWSELSNEADKLLREGDKVKKIAPLQKYQFKNDSFFGDVTARDGDLFFHLFPTDNAKFSVWDEEMRVWTFNKGFVDALTQAFLSVLKHEDRLFLDFVVELQSYVVRCAGFGDNPLQDEIIERILVKIKEKHER